MCVVFNGYSMLLFLNIFDASPELRLFDRVRADNRPVLQSLQRY